MSKHKKNTAHTDNPNMFQCPACGNELYRSDRPQIKCAWCGSWIRPQGKFTNQQAEISEKREDRDRKNDRKPYFRSLGSTNNAESRSERVDEKNN